MTVWDVVVVGAGPAGAAAALGALTARPSARVLLLDRATFPRDKTCGDGIAPQALDLLAGVGVRGLVDDWAPVSHLALSAGDVAVDRQMSRPAWVVPRAVFDERLVAAAVRAGAQLRQHGVRHVRVLGREVVVDGTIRARAVVGADGAYSRVRAAAGLSPGGRRAIAIRGYAPTPPSRSGRQVIAFGRGAQPSYAWAFDRGDGLSNVGYGEALRRPRVPPTRAGLLASIDELLPGSTTGGGRWRAHHLPLSSWRWRQPDGRVLLAGDAAGLVNPLSGEGIYYAVLTGVLAGRAAVGASDGRSGAEADPGTGYRREVRAALSRHLSHSAAANRVLGVPGVAPAALRAASRSQSVFDDLVELGLADGRLTRRVAAGAARGLRRERQQDRRHAD